MIRGLAYLLPVLAMACAPQPMSVERADRLCREDIGLADGVQGRVGVGIGTGGAKAKGGITVTNRVLNPQSEEDYLRECIARRMNGGPAPVTYGVTVGGKT